MPDTTLPLQSVDRSHACMHLRQSVLYLGWGTSGTLPPGADGVDVRSVSAVPSIHGALIHTYILFVGMWDGRRVAFACPEPLRPCDACMHPSPNVACGPVMPPCHAFRQATRRRALDAIWDPGKTTSRSALCALRTHGEQSIAAERRPGPWISNQYPSIRTDGLWCHCRLISSLPLVITENLPCQPIPTQLVTLAPLPSARKRET